MAIEPRVLALDGPEESFIAYKIKQKNPKTGKKEKNLDNLLLPARPAGGRAMRS